MDPFTQFRDDLQSALAHLHNADYQFPARVCKVLGCDDNEVSTVQSRLIQWIASLAPAPNTPQQGRIQQLYGVLHHRFVLGLTQEESAHSLHVSARTLQRLQRNAIHLLARRIWDTHQAHVAVTDSGASVQLAAPATWKTQVQQELGLLQQSTSGATCDLQAAIRGALRVAAESVHRVGVPLVVQGVPENCRVQLHTSIVEQVVLMVIAELEKAITHGEVTLDVAVTGVSAELVFRASPVPAGVEIDLAFAEELVKAQSGKLTLSSEEGVLAATLQLPRVRHATDRYTVLVVDDNADLVALYASYCIDTEYDVIHVGHGNRLVESVVDIRPDVIFLDVLLPDANGWQLLMDLKSTPATRDIPIVVCSVITDAQMALNLGAVLYLQKPVWRQQLLDALSEVLTPPRTSA